MPNNDEVALEGKKLQHRRGWEELEHFRDFTWKVPSVAVAIIAGLISVSKLIEVPRESAILMLCGLALLAVLSYVAYKIRLSESSREEFLSELEENFRDNDLKIKPMPVGTLEIRKYLKERRSQQIPEKLSARSRLAYTSDFHANVIIMVVLAGIVAFLFAFYLNEYFKSVQ